MPGFFFLAGDYGFVLVITEYKASSRIRLLTIPPITYGAPRDSNRAVLHMFDHQFHALSESSVSLLNQHALQGMEFDLPPCTTGLVATELEVEEIHIFPVAE